MGTFTAALVELPGGGFFTATDNVPGDETRLALTEQLTVPSALKVVV
jgi:hypothetical protein